MCLGGLSTWPLLSNKTPESRPYRLSIFRCTRPQEHGGRECIAPVNHQCFPHDVQRPLISFAISSSQSVKGLPGVLLNRYRWQARGLVLLTAARFTRCGRLDHAVPRLGNHNDSTKLATRANDLLIGTSTCEFHSSSPKGMPAPASCFGRRSKRGGRPSHAASVGLAPAGPLPVGLGVQAKASFAMVGASHPNGQIPGPCSP